MVKAKKQKKPKVKLTLDQKKELLAKRKQKKLEDKYRAEVKGIFSLSGMDYIKTDGSQFVFKERTSEIDALFVYKNILIICEDTHGKEKHDTDHLLKKKIIHDLILANKEEFVEFLKDTFPAFNTHCKENPIFKNHHYEIKIAYFSRFQVSEEALNQCQSIFYFDYPRFKYFINLAKIIGKTAKFELFKFFKLNYNQIGDARIQNGFQSSGIFPYKGFLLPESDSNYPAGYKVLTFYIDPERLLEKSHVLRKDSWQDPDCTYQRMLIPRKIREMRKYLNDESRVYINNIIVTLPDSTTFTKTDGKQVEPTELKEKEFVLINLPNEFNSIGLIDGQHRVYSYHEGNDTYEPKIKTLRKCQNLLVTGIMYPSGVKESDQIDFEAKLFLEINDKQAKAKADLKQGIELLVRPFTTAAISKAIINKLCQTGVLKGQLKEHYFDEDYKIKTSSIVSYVLTPLVSLNGKESLINIWQHPKKQEVIDQKNRELLKEYIAFCVEEINKILLAFKLNLLNVWDVNKGSSILNVTTISGFLVCLRQFVNTGNLHEKDYYQEKLKNIIDFPFKNYKSSHWKQLGIDMYKESFLDKIESESLSIDPTM